jgi:hypothetical protein
MLLLVESNENGMKCVKCRKEFRLADQLYFGSFYGLIHMKCSGTKERKKK